MIQRYSLPLLACLTLPLPLAAQASVASVPLGPAGGAATAVAIHPTAPNLVLVTRYIGASPTMPYLSVDAGATFVPYANGLPEGERSAPVRGLVQDPRDGHVLYVLSGPTAIYKSTDFGASWSLLADIATAPNTLKGLAIPTSGTGLLAYDAWDVFHSPDGGATWNVAYSIVPYSGGLVTAIAYAPGNPAVAYAGTTRDGVIKSTDGGMTFTDPDPTFTETIRSVTVSPSSDQVVLAGGQNFDPAGSAALYKSTDGGASWYQPSVSLPTRISPRFFAWEPDQSLVWLGSLGDGIYYSSDLGESWNAANEGFTQPTPQHIPLGMAFDGRGYHYLATESNSLGGFVGGGIYRNQGVGPWQHRAFGEGSISDVAIAGPNGTRIVATAGGPLAAPRGAPVAATAADYPTNAIAVDPTFPDRWLIGGTNATSGAVITVLTTGGTGITQAYVNWNPGPIHDVEFSPIDPANVLAVKSATGTGLPSILISGDRGASWNEVPGTEDWPLRAVAFDPHTPGRVLALASDNTWAESLVGGPNWSPLQPAWPAGPSGTAVFLDFDPFVPGTIYRGETGTGLWRSTDDGATWQPLGVALHADSDLELHPQFPGLLFVGNDAGEVLVSADHGDTFELLFDAPTQASGLAIDTADGSLLVGTTGASTWEYIAVSPLSDLGPGTPGTGGFTPRQYSVAVPSVGDTFRLKVDQVVGGAPGILILGTVPASAPLWGGSLYVGDPLVFPAGVATGTPSTGGAGSVSLPLRVPNQPVFAGASLVSQFAFVDSGAQLDPLGRVLSNGMRWTILP